MDILLHKFSYKYFPYEEEFARKESSSMGKIVKDNPSYTLVRASNNKSIDNRLKKLTYFKGYEVNGNGLDYTDQYLFETLANGKKLGEQHRQSTRYSTHGLHEYKGKFNPQIVKFLIERSALPEKGIVFDPFVGSGTTLVESLHLGNNAIGIDANPLAVEISKAKTFMLKSEEADMTKFENVFRRLIDNVASRTQDIKNYAHILEIDDKSLAYLNSWFPKKILAELLWLRCAVRDKMPDEWASIANIFISSIVRDVSLQEPADLRIRRRKSKLKIKSVAPELKMTLDSIMPHCKAAINLLNNSRRRLLADVYCGNSGEANSLVRRSLRKLHENKVDVIVTSPPYATALPYIDTDRLSLVLLGLKRKAELLKLEKSLIGNREISEREFKEGEEDLARISLRLPSEIRDFILLLHRATKDCAVGFRRRNLPVLLARYFLSINKVLVETTKMLSKEGEAFWIVGRNKTKIGKKVWEINTPKWIEKIAKSNGLRAELTELETYQRYGIHYSNSIRTESLISIKNNF